MDPRKEGVLLATELCGWPPTPPRVSGLSHGFQYLTENRGDEIHELLGTIEDHLVELGLPLLTIEEVPAELRVSRAAFYRWRRQRYSPRQ